MIFDTNIQQASDMETTLEMDIFISTEQITMTQKATTVTSMTNTAE